MAANTENGNCEKIQADLKAIVKPLGFETHPFLVGWYNEENKKVDEKYSKLPYAADTLAFQTLSTPDAFERTLLPYMYANPNDNNPVDNCTRDVMQNVTNKFANTKIVHDFEQDKDGKYFSVQTAGHCAGAAYYYQGLDVKNQPWPATKKVYGVSIHPRYGGWFAFRSAIVFPDISCPKLPRIEPQDVVVGDEKRIELLNKANPSDGTWRDIIPDVIRYSERGREYFTTRREMVERWKKEDNQ